MLVKTYNFKDITGQVYGKLKAIRYTGKNWEFLCQCGNTTFSTSYKVRSGHTKSCGCARSEANAGFKHGMAYSDENKVWCGIKTRCFNPNRKDWKNYGGRGISMCERWLHNFEAFFEDMGRRPSKNHSIERKDNSGDYTPENCIWTTSYVQGQNKRNNCKLTVGGITKKLKEWSKQTGIGFTTLQQRICKGWTPEEVVGVPLNRHRRKWRAKGHAALRC